tara:strand:+ start:525 stop:692 length:168 start_codon:yes stop_codon:yes gene_type:complete
MTIEISFNYSYELVFPVKSERFYNATMAIFADHVCIFARLPKMGCFAALLAFSER